MMVPLLSPEKKKGGVATIFKFRIPENPALYPLLRTCIETFCERCMFQIHHTESSIADKLRKNQVTKGFTTTRHKVKNYPIKLE